MVQILEEIPVVELRVVEKKFWGYNRDVMNRM